MNDRMILLLALTIIFFVVIFAPTLIAYANRHPERRRVAKLNPLALLSFLLWGALLVWAIGGKRDDSVIARFVETQRKYLGWVVAALVVGGVAMSAYAWSQRDGIAARAEAGSSLNTPSTPAAR